MSEDTVKPALTRTRSKRAKRTVETDQFDAFARRIVRAYARRVAAGDVEALRSLTLLSAEVDAATRAAVDGLRQFGYSWQEIADRLGTSRQAAQSRFGTRTDRHGLDARLLDGGLTVTVATLARVFVDHWPGVPAATSCPGCGYVYPDDQPDCPTVSVVRPLLYRRRGEDRQAISLLSRDQLANLHGKDKPARRKAAGRSARPAPAPDKHSLFDLLERGPAA